MKTKPELALGLPLLPVTGCTEESMPRKPYGPYTPSRQQGISREGQEPLPDDKQIDGISYLPTLLDKGKQPEHDFLYWEFHFPDRIRNLPIRAADLREPGHAGKKNNPPNHDRNKKET